MTYQTRDESEESGSPLLLYEFMVGDTAYRLTDRTSPIYYATGGQVVREWVPAVIVPEKIVQSNDIGKDTLDIKIAKDCDLAKEYVDGAPDAVTGVSIFRVFEEEPDPLLYWSGNVGSTDADDQGLILTCSPVFALLKQQGLRALYMSTCRHQLYDDYCALYRGDFDTASTVWAVQGDKVRINAYSARAGFWVGGLLSYNGIERTILAHDVNQGGDWLTLSRPIRSLSVWAASNPGQGAAVILYRGCDHSYAGCKAHGNKGRFGGFPWFRRRNPFTTSIIA